MLTASAITQGDNVKIPSSAALSASNGVVASSGPAAAPQNHPTQFGNPPDSEPEISQQAGLAADRAETDRKASTKRSRIQFGTLDSIVRGITAIPSDVISKGIHSTLQDAHLAASAADQRSAGATSSSAVTSSSCEDAPMSDRVQTSHDSDLAAQANSNGMNSAPDANGHSPFAAFSGTNERPANASAVSLATPTSVFAMGVSGVCGTVPESETTALPSSDAGLSSDQVRALQFLSPDKGLELLSAVRTAFGATV